MDNAIPLPQQPTDPGVDLPPQPACPPTGAQVVEALAYVENVLNSARFCEGGLRCTTQDQYNAAVYLYRVVAQAAAAGTDGPPSWFQDEIKQLREDVRNEMRDLIRTEVKNYAKLE